MIWKISEKMQESEYAKGIDSIVVDGDAVTVFFDTHIFYEDDRGLWIDSLQETMDAIGFEHQEELYLMQEDQARTAIHQIIREAERHFGENVLLDVVDDLKQKGAGRVFVSSPEGLFSEEDFLEQQQKEYMSRLISFEEELNELLRKTEEEEEEEWWGS